MKYHFKIHGGTKGFWAECIELEGCMTQADTRDALHKSMKEALDLYLAEPESSRLVFPLPKEVRESKKVVSVVVDPQVAFAFMLRRERLRRKMTQKMVADQLHVGLYSYQRLESAKTANPRLSTIAKLQKVFPDLPLEKLVA